MFTYTNVLNVLGVDDIEKAEEFYIGKLKLKKSEASGPGVLMLDLGNRCNVMLYPDDNHKAASSAVLTFHVEDIDAAVDALALAGVEVDREDAIVEPDEKGVVRNRSAGRGPDVALFKDSAGNIFSLLQF